jgi:hypothetical protein
MKIFIFCVTSCYLLIANSCINKSDNKTNELSTKKTYLIDADNTKELINLKLTDLADSLRFVILETTRESLLGNPVFIVSDEYILAYSQNEYYKFSAEGKFIKKIIYKGRGPQEISLVTSVYFDKGKNLLYLNDHQKSYLLVYDLKSDQFLQSIEKRSMGFEFVISDSIIISNGSEADALVTRNINGDILCRIPNNKKILSRTTSKVRFQVNNLYYWGNELFTKFERDDTLFIFENNSLNPYLFVKFNTVKDNPPVDMIKDGDRGFSIICITKKSVLISTGKLENVEYYSGGNVSSKSKREYFILDKVTGLSVKVNSFTDDYIGSDFKVTSEGISIPRNIQNGRIIIPLNPLDIRNILVKDSQNNNLSKSIKERLKKINDGINETDNPVLVIGKIKI